MSFLDSIGQRPPGSRQPDSRPTVAPKSSTAPPKSPAPQSVARNDAARAVLIPTPNRLPQADGIHPAVLWGAALIVVGAIAVAAWLGVRVNVVSSQPQAAAGTPVEAAPPAEQIAQKRKSVPSRTSIRPPAKTGNRIDAGIPEPVSDAENEAKVPAIKPVSEAAETADDAISDPATAASLPTLSEDDFVYSSEGAGVVGPRLTSLGFVRRLVSGLRVRTSTIELVVSKSGTVERAKIFSTPAHWEDALLLSRAKTFQFVPAYRNGFPVRYRFVMNVETSP